MSSYRRAKKKMKSNAIRVPASSLYQLEFPVASGNSNIHSARGDANSNRAGNFAE